VENDWKVILVAYDRVPYRGSTINPKDIIPEDEGESEPYCGPANEA